MSDENEFLVIGVDVGGTHTDGVLILRRSKSSSEESFDDEILASVKVPTTANIETGIENAMSALFERDGRDDSAAQLLSQVRAIFLGTTAFVNALLEGRGLDHVAVVRLCGPSSRSLPPFVDFPPSLKQVISAGIWFASGGLRFDGSKDSLVNRHELTRIAEEIARSGASAVVVSGTFSPVDPNQEQEVAKTLRELLPSSIRVTVSAESGQLGLLARENSAILNACLVPTARRAAKSAARAFYSKGVSKTALLFFTANDGSVVTFQQAANTPLRCAACGPTNSLRGAAYLLSHQERNAQQKAMTSNNNINNKSMDRIVLDVGGTSTDAGCLVSSHPRDSNAEAYIAGVRCNHRTTDVVSIALGGGSIVSLQKDGTVKIGPESVGSDIQSKALCFGGSVCTTTCIALAMGSTMSWTEDTFTNKTILQSFCEFDAPSFTATAWEVMQKRFLELVEKSRTDSRPVQVVLVGGGAGLVDAMWLSSKLGGCPVVRPQHSSVANACGSALAQNLGEAETIADMSFDKRDVVLRQLKAKAIGKAGPNAQIIECEEVPLAYLPGNMTRILVRAIAPLDFGRLHQENTEMTPNDEDSQHELKLPQALRLEDSLDVIRTPPNVSNGIWTISEYDAHCLAIGCGILGCGGGGSTVHGKLQLLCALRNGQQIHVVSATSTPPDSVIAPCGFMGAPSVSLEMIGGADQLVAAVRQNMVASNKDGSPLFLAISEIGGSNGILPLLVGGILNRPIVDADLMGRAFPELPMTSASICGIVQTPMTVSDSFGRCVTITTTNQNRNNGTIPVDDAFWTERVLRPLCIEFGCSAGLADPILTSEELRRVGVLGSLSRARRIGDCVLRSPHTEEAIKSLLQQEAGKCIFRGMISDVQRRTTAGFAKGSLSITSDDKKSLLRIIFQNEFLLARKEASEDGGDAAVVGCVPDIITILDVDTARPIATEEARFGFRVCVLLLPVSRLLRTPEALNVVGPGAFSLQETYKSDLYDTEDAGSSQEYSSIVDEFSR